MRMMFIMVKARGVEPLPEDNDNTQASTGLPRVLVSKCLLRMSCPFFTQSQGRRTKPPNHLEDFFSINR